MTAYKKLQCPVCGKEKSVDENFEIPYCAEHWKEYLNNLVEAENARIRSENYFGS